MTLIPGKRSEQVREEWRAFALRSSWWMGRIIGFEDFSLDLHLRMSRWIEARKNSPVRKLGLVPRDHLKTSEWTIADTMRRITADPMERVLLINEIIGNAEDWILKLKSIPERCDLWQWLFPERMPDFNFRWNQTELVFPRPIEFPEATVTPMGVGGASTGRHYSLIKEDDLIGKEAAESPSIMQKAIDQHKLAEHLLADPLKHEIHTFGTRWAPEDLYSWMLKNEGVYLDTFITGCYGVGEDGFPLTEGTPIWPERHPAEELQRIRAKNGPYMFALQMLNRPIAAGATEFSHEWLCYYRLSSREGELYVTLERPYAGERTWRLSQCTRFLVTDPGLSPESRDARTATVVAAIPPCVDEEPFDIVFLSAMAKKVAPKQVLDQTWEEYRRWDVTIAGIESVAGQRAFYYWLIERFPNMALKALKTDTHLSKFSRIRAFWAPFAEQKRIYVHRQQTDLIEEFSSFPNGRTVDLLDAGAYLPQIWFTPDAAAQQALEEEEEASSLLDGRSILTGY